MPITHSASCRFCDQPLHHIFCDLGMSPISNAYLQADQLNAMEPFFPLKTYVCKKCFLVQLELYETPDDLFSDYAYFSSYSESWVRHAQIYAEQMLGQLNLNKTHQVVEIASNDGYLLQFFHKAGVPVLGVEPAANVAEVAIQKGIPTEVQFFGVKTARQLSSKGKQADLLVGNNVLAHVPDLNDFVAGLKILLKSNGTITLEFPHLMQLIKHNQFDTIYHEHFSYFSLYTVKKIMAHHQLKLWDVQELPTHGGSLRIYVCHQDDARPVSDRVNRLEKTECQMGLDQLATYANFQEQVKTTKRHLLNFLVQAKEQGKTVVGYGAPAKGNTLLNYCGIRTDFLDFTVDLSPHKQGCFLPGTHIPVLHPDEIVKTKPDYVLILPWNLKDEIVTQMKAINSWGGRFVVPIPHVEVLL